jgi:hypothetical protein
VIEIGPGHLALARGAYFETSVFGGQSMPGRTSRDGLSWSDWGKQLIVEQGISSR